LACGPDLDPLACKAHRAAATNYRVPCTEAELKTTMIKMKMFVGCHTFLQLNLKT